MSAASWAGISSISAAVAASAALLTIWQARLSAIEERESKRPYFEIAEPGIKQLPQSPPYRLQLTLHNTGSRAASKVSGLILIFPESLEGEPTFKTEFSIANDVPSAAPTPWYIDSVQLSENVPAQFILMTIKYQDAILGTQFSQRFFMRWSGVRQGVTHPDFVHASEAQKQQILSYSESTLAEFDS